MAIDETTLLVPKNDVGNGEHGVQPQPYVTQDRGDGSGQGDIEEVASEPTVVLTPIILPMSIGLFLVAMDQTILISTYAAIGSELHQLQNTSWIATGYMLTITSFQPLYGKMSDIFGRKSCLLFAYATFALGCLFCGLARNLNELVAARAFAGIGGGGMTTMVSIIVSDIVPLRSRGTWQGILNIVFAVGSAAGAPVGGLLADSIGWRWAFLIQVPATLIAIIAVSVALVLPKAPISDFRVGLKRVDFKGAVSLIFAIFFLLFGLDRGGNIAWNDTLTVLSLVAFFVMSLAFVMIEFSFASEPFTPKRIIINRSLFASYLVNFFGMASALAMIFHVSLYLQAVKGQTPSQAGLWLLPSILGGVCGSLAGGLILQKTGKYYYLTIWGHVICLAGTLVIALTTGVLISSFVGIAIGLILAQFGSASGVTTSLVALIANAGPEDQAIATSVSYLFRSLGSVVGVSIGSALLQDALGGYLGSRLSGHDVDEMIRRVRESLRYIDELDSTTRAIVIRSYEDAIHITLWFAVVMAACAVVVSAYIKEKPLAR